MHEESLTQTTKSMKINKKKIKPCRICHVASDDVVVGV